MLAKRPCETGETSHSVNTILKQRLIGALILLALGVVFWPIIFVQPEDDVRAVATAMEEPPVVDTTPIEPPTAAGLTPAQRSTTQDSVRADEQSTFGMSLDPTFTFGSYGDAESATAIKNPDETPEAEPETPVEQPRPETAETSQPLQSVANEPAQTRSEAPVKPALDAQGIPVAWILQVATVSSKDKANQLRDELVRVDEKAYVRPIKRGDKTLYRVYIGPKFEKAKLESIKPRVDASFGVQSLIARYVP